MVTQQMQEAARGRDPEVDAAIAEVERFLRETRQGSGPLLAAPPLPPHALEKPRPSVPSAPPPPVPAEPPARPRRWLLQRLFGWMQPAPRVAQTVTTELRAAPCPSCGDNHALHRQLEVRWTPQELASGQALRRVEVCCPDTGQRFLLPVRFVTS